MLLAKQKTVYFGYSPICNMYDKGGKESQKFGVDKKGMQAETKESIFYLICKYQKFLSREMTRFYILKLSLAVLCEMVLQESRLKSGRQTQGDSPCKRNQAERFVWERKQGLDVKYITNCLVIRFTEHKKKRFNTELKFYSPNERMTKIISDRHYKIKHLVTEYSDLIICEPGGMVYFLRKWILWKKIQAKLYRIKM